MTIQWKDGQRVGATGPAVEFPEPPEFFTASGLVRWFLTRGRPAMGGVRAIDPSRDGGGGASRKRNSRNPFALHDLHTRFALAAKAMDVLSEEQEWLLDQALVDERAYWRIGEELGISEDGVGGRVEAALREVRIRGRALGILPEREELGQPWPDSAGKPYHRLPWAVSIIMSDDTRHRARATAENAARLVHWLFYGGEPEIEVCPVIPDFSLDDAASFEVWPCDE